MLTDGDEVRFTHPIYGSVIYADASREHRHRIHRRLSEVVLDAEERVRHLALAADGPDAAVAAELEAAAQRESRRGPIAAGELFELAEQLTPLDDAETIRRLRLEAADRWFLAGDLERARRLIESARASAPPGRERAEALWRLARLCHHDDARRAVQLSSEALEQEGLPPELISRITTQLAWALAAIGDLPGADRQAEEARAEAERADDRALTIEALIASTFVAAWRGDGRSGGFLHRAEEIAGSDDRRSTLIEPSWSMAVLLQEPDDLDAARRVLGSLVDGAVERGDEFSTTEILAELADAEWRAGNWTAALADLADMQRLAPGSIGLMSNRALVEACMGDVDDAVADGEGALALAETAGLVSARIEALHALGHVRLSLGDPTGANVHLARAWEMFRHAGFGDPGTFPFVPDHVEALVEIGEVGRRRAHRRLARGTGSHARARVRRGDRRSMPGAAPRRGRRPRRRAHVARRSREASRAPDDAVRAGADAPGPGWRASPRRQKRAAREALEQALGMFEELGARLWAERTRSELARIGGRRAVLGELTEAEQRVARLAAAGRTNREIADTLYTSVRTVEGHLSHIYRKLGIRSRTELVLFIDEAEEGSAQP